MVYTYAYYVIFVYFNKHLHLIDACCFYPFKPNEFIASISMSKYQDGLAGVFIGVHAQ